MNAPGKGRPRHAIAPIVILALKTGATPKDIVELTGCSNGYIRQWARKLGLPAFSRGRPEGSVSPKKEELETFVKEQRQAGLTLQAIGTLRGLTRQRIDQILNRGKSNARQRFAAAVKEGRIERPKVCSACGKRKKIHGHHDDYSKPFDVRWLCPKCHYKQHSKNGFTIAELAQ